MRDFDRVPASTLPRNPGEPVGRVLHNNGPDALEAVIELMAFHPISETIPVWTGSRHVV